jgi:chemotaxis methyl-accepting protein methylase
MSSFFWRNPTQQEIVLGLLRGLSRPHAAVRILDVGSNSGELLVSLAILLAEEYGPAWAQHYAITAVDCCPSAIAQFRRGLYPEDRLQRMPPEYRDRYTARCESPKMEPDARTWILLKDAAWDVAAAIDTVCCVFDKFEPEGAAFDVVMCQNTLLHLPLAKAVAWVERFHGMLSAGGYLIAGGHHGERNDEGLAQLRRLFEPVPHDVEAVYADWLGRLGVDTPPTQLIAYDAGDPLLAYRIGSIFRKREAAPCNT